MWLSIVGGVVTIVTTVFGGVMTFLLAKIQRQGAAAAIKVEEVVKKTEEAAVKTEEVKEALLISTEAANKQLTSIHTLVNANMGAQLTISAVALRRVADLTKHPDDVMAAETAEGLLAEHMRKQAAVDKRVLEGGGSS